VVWNNSSSSGSCPEGPSATLGATPSWKQFRKGSRSRSSSLLIFNIKKTLIFFLL
jgi:hypothetical protein